MRLSFENSTEQQTPTTTKNNKNSMSNEITTQSNPLKENGLNLVSEQFMFNKN